MQWHGRKSDLNTTVLVMRSFELSRLCSVLKEILLGILIARDMLRISAEITDANTPVSILILARIVHAHLLSSLRLSLPAGSSRVVQDVEIGTPYRDSSISAAFLRVCLQGTRLTRFRPLQIVHYGLSSYTSHWNGLCYLPPGAQ